MNNNYQYGKENGNYKTEFRSPEIRNKEMRHFYNPSLISSDVFYPSRLLKQPLWNSTPPKREISSKERKDPKDVSNQNGESCRSQSKSHNNSRQIKNLDEIMLNRYPQDLQETLKRNPKNNHKIYCEKFEDNGPCYKALKKNSQCLKDRSQSMGHFDQLKSHFHKSPNIFSRPENETQKLETNPHLFRRRNNVCDSQIPRFIQKYEVDPCHVNQKQEVDSRPVIQKYEVDPCHADSSRDSISESSQQSRVSENSSQFKDPVQEQKNFDYDPYIQNKPLRGARKRENSAGGFQKNVPAPNFDDQLSESSSASHISKIICDKCFNKEIASEKKLNTKGQKEYDDQIEKEAIQAQTNMLIDKTWKDLNTQEEKKRQFGRQMLEELKERTLQKQENQDKLKRQQQAEKEKFQVEQQLLQSQKQDDLRRKREQYNQDIQLQIDFKNEKKNREKEYDLKFSQKYQEHDEKIDALRNTIEESKRQNLNTSFKEGIIHQIEDRKKIDQIKQDEQDDYKRVCEAVQKKELAQKLKADQQKLQQIKDYQEYWTHQQQLKAENKIQEEKEKENLRKMIREQSEHNNARVLRAQEKDKNVKNNTIRTLQDQILHNKSNQDLKKLEKIADAKTLKDEQKQHIAYKRSLLRDCDSCHVLFPSSSLNKQRIYKPHHK